jgi:hypothetical protein
LRKLSKLMKQSSSTNIIQVNFFRTCAKYSL